jgi:hypothetical protein
MNWNMNLPTQLQSTDRPEIIFTVRKLFLPSGNNSYRPESIPTVRKSLYPSGNLSYRPENL